MLVTYDQYFITLYLNILLLFVKAKLNIIPILQKIQLYYVSIIKTTIMNDEYQSIILFTKKPQTLVLFCILMELITIIYSDLSKILIISHSIQNKTRVCRSEEHTSELESR